MSEKSDEMRQERSASIIMLVSIGAILFLGAPCFCYFGAGLFMGLDQFNSGRYKNPARQKRVKYVRPEEFKRNFSQPKKAPKYRRPEKYNRSFQKKKDSQPHTH